MCFSSVSLQTCNLLLLYSTGMEGDPDLQFLLQGGDLLKVRSSSWKKTRYFKLMEDCKTMWRESKKTFKPKQTCECCCHSFPPACVWDPPEKLLLTSGVDVDTFHTSFLMTYSYNIQHICVSTADTSKLFSDQMDFSFMDHRAIKVCLKVLCTINWVTHDSSDVFCGCVYQDSDFFIVWGGVAEIALVIYLGLHP